MKQIQSAQSFGVRAVVIIAVAAAVIGCAGKGKNNDMNQLDRLSGCSGPPNCVSSESEDPRHSVDPMQLLGDSNNEWLAIQDVVDRLPRSRIVKATDRYLHVTLKSKVLGFIDDLELMLDPQTEMISIRSAARSGYFDLGVNRRRVEKLRKQLQAAELIR
ncbi:MAG: DUF1499 domain-containing protein [Deltaproteobacteria bacterium]|nr:DUF1499 domain-containing protein [Deltaproteobacteria bacterium]